MAEHVEKIEAAPEKRKSCGATRHCCFGLCNSDSRCADREYMTRAPTPRVTTVAKKLLMEVAEVMVSLQDNPPLPDSSNFNILPNKTPYDTQHPVCDAGTQTTYLCSDVVANKIERRIRNNDSQKQRFPNKDLAYRFGVSQSTISITIDTWIQFLFKTTLFRKKLIPSKMLIKEKLPASFRSFKNVRVIIDCFEIFVQSSRNFAEQGNIYSSYKNHVPLRVRGCRIGPTCFATCRKRRLSRGDLFAVGCDPCRRRKGSWQLSGGFSDAILCFGLYFA
ncbi:hypothetical protein ACJMK2_039824 [Sinanodonta woodiana]|uniref:Transposase Helix-turn-helix domain-containing protein n=1 Tax=Sinanodonta woodiana TaxID=1069815 RepID=A0ABD3WGL7_SINWO